MIRALERTLVLVAIVAATGCAAPSYINIPPLPGDTALHSPNGWVVRDVMVESLNRALKTFPPNGPYDVAFPPGVTDTSRDLMLAGLSPNQPEGPNPDAPLYRVAQVWVRGLSARVDIVVPNVAGEARLVSVACTTDIEGWYAKPNPRVWRVPVPEALRLARPVDNQELDVQAPATPEPTPTTRRSSLGASDRPDR
ncbi:MAG: hypothetical protein ACYTGQ_05295, partial [Planctomycetota bacterium]